MPSRLALHLLAALALAALVLTGSTACSKGPALKEMTVDQVAALVAAKDGKTFIYDNNDQDRYAKSHVPGARWVDYEKVTAADLPPDKAATLVFYCSSEL